MYFKALVFHGQSLQLLVQRHYQEEKIMEYSIVLARKSRHEKKNLNHFCTLWLFIIASVKTKMADEVQPETIFRPYIAQFQRS